MALLKISDSKRKIKGVAIGIDLGTTHSLVAVYHDNQLQVIPDQQGEVLLPSVVRYVQGKEIRSIKRLMGTEKKVEDHTPVEISAEILKVLYARAQAFLKDEPILGAVVTVPAYFDEVQRQATKQAAKIAGLPIIRLINEPTAAAIAYGLNQKQQGTYLVFDLGGGTFDISLLSMQTGIFEVLATGGDTLLGGDDIDKLLAQWICEAAQLSIEECWQSPDLLLIAKQVKETLTIEAQVEISYQHWTGVLSRHEFNALILPLIEKMIRHCDRVLQDAHIEKQDINEMILVGGATRMPCLRVLLSQWFGKTVHTDLDPDQIVAMGAALQADQLTGNRAKQNLLLLDVIPLSLGLEIMSGTVEKMVMRNAPLPATCSETFTTYQDNQTGLMLHVVQGERELVKDCRSLARFHLKGFPAMPAGMAKIKVTFLVDVDGLLTVTAEELTSHTYVEVVVEAAKVLDA